MDNSIPEFQGKQKRLQFINYGSTQLVFVLTIDEKRQYTILVNQPAAPLGIGKREFDNLAHLNKSNKDNVIKPLHYFQDKQNPRREAYITPYSYQARCIGVEKRTWGVWVPEPQYLFHDFSLHDKKVINSSMVALLIQFYDEQNKSGLSEIRLDGGDFMLEKGLKKRDINNSNVLKKMKLIAARNMVQMDLNDYISQLTKELSGQIKDKNDLRIIGKRLRCPFALDEIETGISLGMSLREKQKEKEEELSR